MSVSLASALRKSVQGGTVSTETESAIIIDRSTFASRKRGRLALSTLSNVPRSMEEGDAFDEAIYWRDKFDAMTDEKNKFIKNFTAQIALHKEKEIKLEEYATLLEQKVQKLNAASTPARMPRETERVDQERLQELEKLNTFYQLMTATTIRIDGDDYLCTVKNLERRALTKFIIRNPLTDEDKIEFVPTANADLLPEYLQDGVTSFERILAPLLVGDVLQTLFAE